MRNYKQMRELEERLLAALGLADRTDVAEVSLSFRAGELPRATVSFEVFFSDTDLGPVLDHIAEHYTLVPNDPEPTDASVE